MDTVARPPADTPQGAHSSECPRPRRRWLRGSLLVTAVLVAGVTVWCRPYGPRADSDGSDEGSGAGTAAEEPASFEDHGPLFSFVPERRNWIRDFARVPTVVSGSADGEQDMSDHGTGCIGLTGRLANHRARVAVQSRPPAPHFYQPVPGSASHAQDGSEAEPALRVAGTAW